MSGFEWPVLQVCTHKDAWQSCESVCISLLFGNLRALYEYSAHYIIKLVSEVRSGTLVCRLALSVLLQLRCCQWWL